MMDKDLMKENSTLRWTAQKHIPLTQMIFGWVPASFILAFLQVFKKKKKIKFMFISHSWYNLPLVTFVFSTGKREGQCLGQMTLFFAHKKKNLKI